MHSLWQLPFGASVGAGRSRGRHLCSVAFVVEECKMAVASAALQLPLAPKDGEYHRMVNPAERFKNGMKVQLLGSIAIFEVPKRKKKVSHTLTLNKETENSCTVDWRPVNTEWNTARLQYAVLDGVEGMLEEGNKFWKLYTECSPTEVAQRVMQHMLPSSFPQLEDAVDASAAASTSPDLGDTQSSRASNQLAQRRRCDAGPLACCCPAR